TYCIRKIDSCRFCLFGDKKLIYSMFTFSGWDLYGNASVLARTQGVNILLNMFFGAVLNAASGIASQIQTAVMSFAGSVLSAVRPQMIKSYAVGDYNRMINLIYKASMYTSILLLLFTIPLLIETDFEGVI
ncbi:polysaccharide biosynthesis protein, partial [Bacteroides thetaiotaomicron]